MQRATALLVVILFSFSTSDEEPPSHPPTILFVTGIPGAGKTTLVRNFVNEQPQLRAQSSPGGCAWLESEDANLLVLGKWSSFHDSDNDNDDSSVLRYRPQGDGTDRLGGPMPSPTLLRSCIDAIAILRAQGKARLVIADGLLFLLASSSSFVDVLQEAPHGYRVLIRELDVDEDTAEARREQRDGEHVAWVCDEACEIFFSALRARPQWEAVAEERMLPLMRRLAAEQLRQSAGDGECTADAPAA